jgi:hypothetical protein
MTTQSAFLGLLIATLCGLLYHLIRGGGLSRLGLYVVTAWVAFFTGHLVGNWLDGPPDRAAEPAARTGGDSPRLDRGERPGRRRARRLGPARPEAPARG